MEWPAALNAYLRLQAFFVEYFLSFHRIICMDIKKQELLFSDKDLWILIWPLIIELLLQITLGIADNFMVSRLGQNAVSGVSLVDQINVLLSQIFAALSTGGAVVCSQYIGRKEHSNAEKTAKQLLYTILSVSVVLMFFGLVFRRGIISILFGDIEEEVMDNSLKYFFLTLFALPSIAVYSAASALFCAQGNSRFSMLIALLVNILNIGGNALLIFGFRWGVEGVAVPTLVSRTVAAAVLFIGLYRAKDFNGNRAVSVKGITKVKLDFHLIGKILKIGVPNGLENSSFQIGKILVLSVTASFGTAAIAANAVANTITLFEVLPGNACSLAILTVCGQCMGAGKTDQAVHYTKKLMGISIVSMAVCNIFVLSIAKFIIGFYNLPAETSQLAFIMAFVHGFFGIFIWSFSFTLPNALRAANYASFTMIVSIISMWVCRVGLSYVFKNTGAADHVASAMNMPSSYGALSIWFAMIVDWIARSVAFIISFARGKWKKHSLV